MSYSTVTFTKPLEFSQQAFIDVTNSRSRVGGISVVQSERSSSTTFVQVVATVKFRNVV